MRRPFKISRALLAVILSVVLLIWCLAAAARDDNARFLTTMHAAHRGTRFNTALDSLRGKATDRRIDECTACHTDRGLFRTLIEPRASVPDTACGGCHSTDKAASLGRPLKVRFHRPAHQVDLSAPTTAGLARSEHGSIVVPMSCGSCHPDHRGAEFKPADIKNAFCNGCHVPASTSAQAQAVLLSFARVHKEKAFWEIEDRDFGSLPAVMKAIGKQKCTGCHGEHEPQDDGDRMPAAAGGGAP